MPQDLTNDKSTLVQVMAWCRQLHALLFSTLMVHRTDPGIILGKGSANERRRYIVTSSLIGRAHAQNDPSHQQQNVTQFKRKIDICWQR